MNRPALHHIALACRDVEATHRFYHDLLGFPLVFTESQELQGGRIVHFFYDIGDGSCIAFFDLHGVGEPEQFDTAISTGLGLPIWVNHVAIRAEQAKVDEVRARAEEKGVKPTLKLDHGWCRSLYFTDPNGILVELCVDSPGFEFDEDEAALMLGLETAEAG